MCSPDLQQRPRCRWLCLSALTEAEDTQHPSRDITQVRGKQEPSRDAELHPECSAPPSFHSHPAQKKQESTLLIALPWSCSPFMWFQCLSRSSLHFQRTACTHTHTTQLLNGMHPTVCVLTLLLLPRRKKAHACICTYTQRLSKRHCLHFYSSGEAFRYRQIDISLRQIEPTERVFVPFFFNL